MRSYGWMAAAGAAVASLSGLTEAWAANTFTGAGFWHEPARWSAGVPADGDVVVIDGLVTNTASTAVLGGYTLNSGATHVFTGTNTFLLATNATLYGTMTHLPQSATETNAWGEWVSDHQIKLRVFGDLTVAAGGWINANLAGFQGNPSGGRGRGQGAGLSAYNGGHGAGHGGHGGRKSFAGLGGMPYGHLEAPSAPGSSGGGGASPSWPGGHGGGLVRIVSDGNVTVDGVLSADGGAVTSGGTGAGGSIFITCATFDGAQGTIRADGGVRQEASGQYRGGGGSGGRIAVVATDLPVQSNLTPTVRFSANGGTLADAFGAELWDGALGTVWLSTAGMFPLDETLAGGGALHIPGFTHWTSPSLTITNGGIRFPSGFQLNVNGDLVVTHAGGLVLSNSHLNVGGDLVISNRAAVYVHADTAGDPFPGYGVRISVTGGVKIAAHSSLNPWCHPTNGAAVFFDVGAFTLAPDGRVRADGRGYRAGHGDGRGTVYTHGGSYGGVGGRGGRATYGSYSAPTQPGSGGGTTADLGAQGGGAVRIHASGPVRIDGTISANGLVGTAWGAGGGSGGSVYITCETFDGGGLISADGGAGTTYPAGGGGGGGRVSIVYTDTSAQASLTPSLNVTADGGSADSGQLYAGERGTLFVTDTSFLPRSTMDGHNYMFFSPGFDRWEPDRFEISNSSIRFEDGFVLAVTNDIVIHGNANVYQKGRKGLEMRNHFRLSCGGNLTVTNAAALRLGAGATNEVEEAFGGTVVVGGRLTVSGNSTITPFSHPMDGGSCHFSVGHFTLAAGSRVDANAKGFDGAYGPGSASHQYGGAGYGGRGGHASGGATYGDPEMPLSPGSGNWSGGYGGGSVAIVAGGTMRIDGDITANGAISPIWGSGGGSGGGIYLSAAVLRGTGTLSAYGADSVTYASPLGGGGGGRIAVWIFRGDQWGGAEPSPDWCRPGAGRPSPDNDGEMGTLIWRGPSPATLILLR